MSSSWCIDSFIFKSVAGVSSSKNLFTLVCTSPWCWKLHVLWDFKLAWNFSWSRYRKKKVGKIQKNSCDLCARIKSFNFMQDCSFQKKSPTFPFMATDWRWCWTPKRLKVQLPTFTTGFGLPSIKIVYYQHLLVPFEELLSLRLSDHFALVVGCINNNWLNLWKKDACKVFTGISPPLQKNHISVSKIWYKRKDFCRSLAENCSMEKRKSLPPAAD